MNIPNRIWATLNVSPIGNVLQGTFDLERSEVASQVEYVRLGALPRKLVSEIIVHLGETKS